MNMELQKHYCHIHTTEMSFSNQLSKCKFWDFHGNENSSWNLGAV